MDAPIPIQNLELCENISRTASGMAYFKVDSFHINVGGGDGAIHLLSSGPEAHTNGQRLVQRAIMIDGGRGTALGQINDLITWIQNNYYCQANFGNFLMFDSFVITHWDGDHHEGIGYLIYQEINNVLNSKTWTNPEEQVYCKRARYGAINPNTGHHGPPLSFLYMPWKPQSSAGFEQNAGNKANQPLNAMVDVTIPVIGGAGATRRFNRQFKMRAGRDCLLARNLFMHDRDDTLLSLRGNEANFATLPLMLQNSNVASPAPALQTPGYLAWPAMFCVAAERRTPASTEPVETLDLTPTNMSSLVFLLVWWEGAAHGFRVTHYFAADAYAELETELRIWMNGNPPYSMKLSHHGSSSSNPKENWNRFNPKNIVVSAGDQYGHPRKRSPMLPNTGGSTILINAGWEVLFAIDAWYQRRKYVEGDFMMRKPFYPCQFPAYITKNRWGEFILQTYGVAEFLTDTPLRAWLQDSFDEIRHIRVNTYGMTIHPNDTIDKFVKFLQKFINDNGRDPYAEEIRPWITEHVLDIMARISPPRVYTSVDDMVTHVVFEGNRYVLRPDPMAPVNQKMADIVAVNIISAPRMMNEDGQVEIVGENLLAQQVTQTWNVHLENMIPFPNVCSHAFVVANLVTPNEHYIVDQYPFLGDDRPMRVDITQGNPQWPTPKDLGHVTTSTEIKRRMVQRHRRDHSWIDVDFEEFISTDSSSESTSDSDSDFRSYPSRTQKPSTPTILYRRVPSNIITAAVYIACDDSKTGKPQRLFPADSEAMTLHRENHLYGFTDTLHHRKFSLASVPDNMTPTPVFETDELFIWLARFCDWNTPALDAPPPADFELSLCPIPWPVEDKAQPLEFIMKIPFLDSKNRRTKLTFSTAAGAVQTFAKSTTSNASSDTAVLKPALTNMLISRRTIVFGLESCNSKTVTTLSLAAKLVGLNLDLFPIFKFLTGELELTLDPAEDFHNAIWFRPGMEYLTNLRLQFHVDLSEFNKWLSTISTGLKVSNLQVIMRKKANWVWGAPKDSMKTRGSAAFLCTFKISETVQLEGVFELSELQVVLTLTLERPKDGLKLLAMQGRDGALESIINWLTSKFGLSDTSTLDELLTKSTNENGALEDDSILPRRIQLTLNLNPETGSIESVSSLVIDIEVCVTIGRSAVTVMNKEPALFLFSFGWINGSGFYFKGKLWAVLPDTPFTQYQRATPEFEEYQLLKPATAINPENQLRTLDLATLLSTNPSEQIQIPAGLPNEIYSVEVEISQIGMSFRGGMRCKPQKSVTGSSTPPVICFEDVSLAASYEWGDKKKASENLTVSLRLSMNLYLNGALNPLKPREEEDAKSVKLMGQLAYDKGQWRIEASAINLSISHLLNFWDVDDRGPILEFLGSIKIDYLTIAYEFAKASKNPSKLSFAGQFGIANVAKLGLVYLNQGGDNWSFTASLAPENEAGETATIGNVLSGFVDQETVLSLPEAITHAEITGANGEKALRLLVAKKGGVSVFALLIHVQMIQLWFIQLRTKDGNIKRIVKAAISKVSVEVAVLNTTINSPWEKLFFMWVQDNSEPVAGKEKKKILKGITRVEYDAMKTCLGTLGVMEEDMMLFKEKATKSDANSIVIFNDEKKDDKTKDIVIAAGSHIVIVAKKLDGNIDIVLDHLFDSSSSKKKPKQKSSSKLVPYAKPTQPDATGSEKGVKAPFKVKLGPLSVQNVGLWYKDGMIGITLDATLIMGPVGLALLGFTIGVPFGKEYSLANPPPMSAIAWGLQGLMVSLNKPPLTIAGGFMRDTSHPDISVMYAGGLVVSFKPWSFEAMGVYANIKKTPRLNLTTIDMNPMSSTDLTTTDDGTFTFSFIYMKLNGPLFSVGFADFAGLVGGFGINSDIMLPTVEQIFEFPFIAERGTDDAGAGPIEKMQALMSGPWFHAAEGAYWGAVGVRVTAFQMLAANAVLVVQFGNDNLLIGIFGVATCDVPSLSSSVKFSHVELGIVCTLDVGSGIFKLEAQLSPRSFILAPQCHLTGGMAVYSWSKTDTPANIQAGDWVLTIGGYHQAFHPPPQYPRPPRLGINWSLNSSLSVTGEAYFAITPKLCMGGGRIHAALSLGALYAWFDAFVDFLMNFEPFFFQLQARIAVGVRFTLDLWLVTVRINAEVSASLDFAGPPFSGVVHVDFWVFGFDVKFGAPPPPPPAVSLTRFWEVVLKSGGANNSSLLVDATRKGDTAAITFTCESGLLPAVRKSGVAKIDEDPWFVKSGKFSMLATFQFAVTEAKLVEKMKTIVPDVLNSRRGVRRVREVWTERDAEAPILPIHKEVFAKPMQLYSPLTSIVEINVLAPRPKMTQGQRFHSLATWEAQKWKLVPEIKPVQTSIWGRYDRNLDPSLVKSPKEELLNGKDATMPLVMGLMIHPPNPSPAKDLVNKFNITSDHMQTVNSPQDTENWPLYVGVDKKQDKAWQPRGSSEGMKWPNFMNCWKNIGEKKSNKAVEIWAKRLRFDKESFDQDHKGDANVPKFSPLTGNAPVALLDRFGGMVPALPLISIGCY